MKILYVQQTIAEKSIFKRKWKKNKKFSYNNQMNAFKLSFTERIYSASQLFFEVSGYRTFNFNFILLRIVILAKQKRKIFAKRC